MQNILVYLGSSTPAAKAYTLAVQELGEGLARRGLTLVYGGSNKGTMTILADAVLHHGGQASAYPPGRWQRSSFIQV